MNTRLNFTTLAMSRAVKPAVLLLIMLGRRVSLRFAADPVRRAAVPGAGIARGFPVTLCANPTIGDRP